MVHPDSWYRQTTVALLQWRILPARQHARALHRNQASRRMDECFARSILECQENRGLHLPVLVQGESRRSLWRRIRFLPKVILS